MMPSDDENSSAASPAFGLAAPAVAVDLVCLADRARSVDPWPSGVRLDRS